MYAIGIASVQTRGASKKYCYHAAQVYRLKQSSYTGKWYWELYRTGRARRGRGVLKQDAEELSQEYGSCRIYSGSLHHRPA